MLLIWIFNWLILTVLYFAVLRIGVLGGGGSGKSTLIKLLCGQTLATTGEVFLSDSSIHHHRVQFLKHIGYCPQVDL